MKSDYTPRCPYCNADLTLTSGNLGLYPTSMDCPFCNKKIYGVANEAGEITLTKYNPNKLVLIAVICFILFAAVIFVLFFR
jgi:uncharacterized protein with PIN domain